MRNQTLVLALVLGIGVIATVVDVEGILPLAMADSHSQQVQVLIVVPERPEASKEQDEFMIPEPLMPQPPPSRPPSSKPKPTTRRRTTVASAAGEGAAQIVPVVDEFVETDGGTRRYTRIFW